MTNIYIGDFVKFDLKNYLNQDIIGHGIAKIVPRLDGSHDAFHLKMLVIECSDKYYIGKFIYRYKTDVKLLPYYKYDKKIKL